MLCLVLLLQWIVVDVSVFAVLTYCCSELHLSCELQLTLLRYGPALTCATMRTRISYRVYFAVAHPPTRMLSTVQKDRQIEQTVIVGIKISKIKIIVVKGIKGGFEGIL